MEGKGTDASQTKQVQPMDCDIGHKSSNADYRPLAVETESQPGVTIEEIMQKMREREIEILLRAGFPAKDDDKLETISIISNTTCSTMSISETESESDSDFTTVTELDTSLSTWSLAENREKDQLREVDSFTVETDNLERKKSFAESLFCFPCCFKTETPLAPVSSYLISSCRFLNIRILVFLNYI
ncbi:uncharacterized protein LOC111106963 isoform X2 [Crassostrea virginica]